MAETKKTTTTKKATTTAKKPATKKAETTSDNTSSELEEMKAMMAQMMAQMNALKEENDALKEEAKTTSSASSDDAEKYPPSKRIKVCSLIPNLMILSTEGDGRGKVFEFERFGATKPMRVEDIENILSVSTQKSWADKGYFYFLDKDFAEYVDVHCDTADIKLVEKVIDLADDEAVDTLCSMDKNLAKAYVQIIAENIIDGKKYDLNKIADIKERIGLDANEIAYNLKDVLKR